jgi:hypothetical protein
MLLDWVPDLIPIINPLAKNGFPANVSISPDHELPTNRWLVGVAAVIPVFSVHFDFIDHLGHPLDPGDGLLGDLFLMEAGQATSQEKGAVVVLTQYPCYVVVQALEEAIRRSLLNPFEIDGGVTTLQGMHRT